MQYVDTAPCHIRKAAQCYSDQAYRAIYVHEKYAPEQIARTIRRTKGGIAATVRLLRCAKTNVHRFLALHPDLPQLAKNEMELVLDGREVPQFGDAVNGGPAARKFVLTHGGDRVGK